MVRDIDCYDIKFIIECLRLLKAESPIYGNAVEDERYVRLSLRSMITHDSFVGVIVDRVGFMFGGAAMNWYSPELIVYEQLLYVRPDKRGGSSAARLIRAFEDRAREKCAVEIRAGATVGVTDVMALQLYERLGYERFGAGVRKRIQ